MSLCGFSQILGSYFVAKETATILRQVISTSRWRDVNVLLEIVTQVGARLATAQPNGKIIQSWTFFL